MSSANKKNQKSKSPKNAPKRDANGQFAKKSAASNTPKSKASEAKSYGPGEGKKDDGSDVIGILRITEDMRERCRIFSSAYESQGTNSNNRHIMSTAPTDGISGSHAHGVPRLYRRATADKPERGSEKMPRLQRGIEFTRTEESATGSTSTTTTYNIKSDGTREKVDEYGEGSQNCDTSEPQGKDCLVPVLQAIEAQNPPKIIVGGHPYFSERFVEDAKKAAVSNSIPSFAEFVAGLQRVSALHEQCKRLRRRELAKKLAQVSSKVIMWGLSLGLVALASVGIYTLGMHAFR